MLLLSMGKLAVIVVVTAMFVAGSMAGLVCWCCCWWTQSKNGSRYYRVHVGISAVQLLLG
jgi:hypothetical protein